MPGAGGGNRFVGDDKETIFGSDITDYIEKITINAKGKTREVTENLTDDSSVTVKEFKPAGNKTHLSDFYPKYNETNGLYVAGTEKNYGVKGMVPDLAANGWWEPDVYAGEGMQYPRLGEGITRAPASDLDYTKRTLLPAGEINKDADLSIYGWKPGAIEPDEEGSLEQDLITTGQADLDAANARRLQEEQTKQRNIMHRADSLSPVTKEIIETAAQDLEAAGNDQAAREGVFENVKEGLMDFAEMNPQLAKSILSTIAAMVMGASFGDAIATGFGVHEEAAMKEEAASDAEAGEIIAMMIENAEWLTDDNFEAILAQYPHLSDDTKKSINMKWEIAKNTADKVKSAKKLAEILTDIEEFSTSMSTKYSNSKNVTIVGPAITDFLTYASKQLGERKEPTSIVDSRQKPALERAIGVYAGRVDRAIENEDGRELDTLRSGGIEAIWEGMHGSFRFVDGKPHSDILVPESQEGNYGIALMVLDKVYKGNKTKIETYLANKRQEWEENIMGKTFVTFNETDKEVATLEAEGKYNTAAKSGYFSWLLAKIYAEQAEAQ
jgi:hypothetical protein